eukprot:6205392-Pleurochrysis_carterae.AAC.1
MVSAALLCSAIETAASSHHEMSSAARLSCAMTRVESSVCHHRLSRARAPHPLAGEASSGGAQGGAAAAATKGELELPRCIKTSSVC